MQCVNLHSRFGKRFKIAFDPAYQPRGVPWAKRDPWMMVIPCERGEIYPFGGDELCVEVAGRPITVNRLAALGLPCLQDGDTEKAFKFHVDQFDAVAKIVKPKRKRVMTEAQKRKAAETLKPYQFASRTSERSQRPQTAETVPA